LASGSIRFSILPASVCDFDCLGVEDEEMTVSNLINELKKCNPLDTVLVKFPCPLEMSNDGWDICHIDSVGKDKHSNDLFIIYVGGVEND
jgi:hypothetical protein